MRKQRRGQIGPGLHPQHPAERPEDPTRLRPGVQQGHQIGVVGQHVPELRGAAGGVMAEPFDHPAEPRWQPAFWRDLLPFLLRLNRPRPGRTDPEPAGAMAGDEGFDPSHDAAEIGREQQTERNIGPVFHRPVGRRPAQMQQDRPQPLREVGRSYGLGRKQGVDVIHERILNT